jgi:hypothetical protein
MARACDACSACTRQAACMRRMDDARCGSGSGSGSVCMPRQQHAPGAHAPPPPAAGAGPHGNRPAHSGTEKEKRKRKRLSNSKCVHKMCTRVCAHHRPFPRACATWRTVVRAAVAVHIKMLRQPRLLKLVTWQKKERACVSTHASAQRLRLLGCPHHGRRVAAHQRRLTLHTPNHTQRTHSRSFALICASFAHLLIFATPAAHFRNPPLQGVPFRSGGGRPAGTPLPRPPLCPYTPPTAHSPRIGSLIAH